MKTSPNAPLDLPSWNSSVFASCKQSSFAQIRGPVVRTYLKVHVPIRAHKEALVLETPLEPNIHRLTSQLLDERLRVDRIDLMCANMSGLRRGY